MTMHTLRGLAALSIGLFAIPAYAQVVAPPKPESYRATIRYRIAADRDGRITQFRELQANLKAAGFKPDPREDANLDERDPSADRFDGTVAGSTAYDLLNDPRVLSVVLTPANAPVTGEVAQISAQLPSGLFVEQQQKLHHQVVLQLEKLGFQENPSYDHQKFSRVRGSIPASALASLHKDLRGLPSGWFVPVDSRSELPLPIRNVNPLRIVEVLANAPDATPTIPADTSKGKLAAEVVALTTDPARKDQPAIVEMLMNEMPGGGVRELADRCNLVARNSTVEGFTGQAVIVRVVKGSDANELTRLPEVRHIRLPRAISETGQSAGASTESSSAGDTLARTRIDQLHAQGFQGAGVKVIVIATGFPGLPANASNIVDLTAEQSPTLEPLPADPRHPGMGTATALAVRAAAPQAELILVRIDPYAFHQLNTIARAAVGSPDSDSMRGRLAELNRESANLIEKRKVVMEEYSQAIQNLSDEDKPRTRREAVKVAFDKLKAEEASFNQRLDRFKALRAGLTSMASAAVIVNTVISEVGQPHDGHSSLNGILNEKFAPKPHRSAIKVNRDAPAPVWVQAAGDAPQSVWAGPFSDVDGNGVMEFAKDPAKGLWTNELNFLTVTGPDRKTNGTLAAGSKIRITAQWREPIDVESGIDYSQHPLTLKLLRQFDPTGKTAATDEMVEVARAAGTPVRIYQTASSAVFEQTLDVTILTNGHYALRVDGRMNQNRRSVQLPNSEIVPRIVVDAGDAATAEKGLIGFESYNPKLVGVGIPGESTLVTTVGTKTSQWGAGPGITLLPKPDVIAPSQGPDGKSSGPAISAGYVGGSMACLASIGMRPKNLPQTIGIAPGSELVFSDEFLRYLPRR
ncbi:MAG: hypothetical protein U0798_03605 [Gemmataceae bacterium]